LSRANDLRRNNQRTTRGDHDPEQVDATKPIRGHKSILTSFFGKT
jgi:hypothetical protein